MNHWPRACNFLASALLVLVAGSAYAFSPHYGAILGLRYGVVGLSLTGLQYLVSFVTFYLVALAFYYGLQVQPVVSKSVRFLASLGRMARSPSRDTWRGLSAQDKLAVRATLLKGFFGPMMAIICLEAAHGLVNNAIGIINASPGESFLALFNRHGFWFVIQVITLLDVGIFTVGYLVETPALKNEIRSVDPTFLGCAAALLCYYPFSSLSGYILGREVSDFPQFGHPAAHLVLNVALLALMVIYVSASVALGFKASNLTHRGIVASGPYAWVRHPAYTAKNMAWWIGAVPMVGAAFAQSTFAGVSAIASVVGWTLLYVMRALTEEDHLRSVDGEYAAYQQHVKYRFIPGVL